MNAKLTDRKAKVGQLNVANLHLYLHRFRRTDARASEVFGYLMVSSVGRVRSLVFSR